MLTKIRGIRASGGGSGEEIDIRATRQGSLEVAQMLPAGTLITARGESYIAIATAVIAFIVDEPDTAAMLTLYNGEADGGKSYVIERIFAYCDVGTTAEARFALWACVHPIGRAADSAEITLINNARGAALGTSYGGNAKLDNAATVTNDGWSPWSGSKDISLGNTLGGSAIVVNVRGRMIVPPSAAVSLSVVSTSTGETGVTGFHWHEVQLDLG